MGIRVFQVAVFAAISGPLLAVTPRESADAAHEEIWRRFIAPDGTMLDYTDREGKVILPTAEQCENNMPNALGWWSPIENGSFYGGVYMDGLVSRWEKTKDPEAAARASKLASGLERLANAGSNPAFIARGFADDGQATYVSSSDDQSYPWFYGMWRYLSSGIPDPAEKARLAALVERVAAGFEAIQWQIPTNRDGFGFFGGWDGDHCDANARLLFILRATHAVTGNPKWLELYRTKSVERRGKEQKTRLELIAAGSHYVAPGVTPNYPMHPPVWTSASTQAGIRALSDLETNPEVRAHFQSALATNAKNALVHLREAQKYHPDEAAKLGFNIDWRSLNEPSNGWAPQQTVQEGIKVGSNQWMPWKKLSPRRIYENDFMRDPLCAAWVISLGEEQSLREEARRILADAAPRYRWEEMNTACMFWAENTFWRLYDQ